MLHIQNKLRQLAGKREMQSMAGAETSQENECSSSPIALDSRTIENIQIQIEGQRTLEETATREALIEEVARRVYDENRKFVSIPPGMANQIYRNGLLTTKTSKEDGFIYMTGARNYWREYAGFIFVQNSRTCKLTLVAHEQTLLKAVSSFTVMMETRTLASVKLLYIHHTNLRLSTEGRKTRLTPSPLHSRNWPLELTVVVFALYSIREFMQKENFGSRTGLSIVGWTRTLELAMRTSRHKCLGRLSFQMRFIMVQPLMKMKSCSQLNVQKSIHMSVFM